MAQRVIGLDIGSHSVKVAVFNASFRSYELVELVERPVGRSSIAPWSEEWKHALTRVLTDLRGVGILQSETIVTSMPGDKLSSRIMTLPFTEAKQIESTLGFELENFLPYSAEDIIYDYIVLEKRDAQTRIMAFAVERQAFETVLEILDEAGIDPRFVGVGSLSYIHLIRQIPVVDTGPIAVIDIGAAHTDIAVFNRGVPELVRTVLRGGNQVTEAIARALGTELDRAEQVKREEGLIAVPGSAFLDDRQALIAAAAREAIDPLIQRIHMTLQARLAQIEASGEIAHIYLSGGGAQLRNIYDYLEQALEIPTEPLPLGSLEWNRIQGESRDDPRFAKTVSHGLRGTSGAVRDDINFRRGTFAYKGDFAYLKGKLAYLALLVVALLGVGGFKAYLKYDQLVQQRDAQFVALEDFSKAVLGRPMDDFGGVLDELKKVPSEDTLDVFPQMTAAHALYDITTIMVDVGNTSRAEVQRMRGESSGTAGESEPLPPGIRPPDTTQLPGAGEARDPSAPTAPAMPPGVDPLFPEGPPGMRPPGPAQAPMPGMDTDALREERARRLREFRERRATPATPRALPAPARLENVEGTADRPRGIPVTTPAQPPAGVPGLARPMAPLPVARPGISPPTAFGDAPAMLPPPPEADDRSQPAPAEAPPSDIPVEERLILELELVTIESGSISLKGEANSIEAATLFEQKLREHACFREVALEGTERITFERHRNWYSFRMAMKMDCRAEDDAKGEGKDGG